MHRPYIVPLELSGNQSLELVGGKAASLGELLRAGFTVPPGFSVTTEVLQLVLRNAGAGSQTANQFIAYQEMIHQLSLPEPIRRSITAAYEDLRNQVAGWDGRMAVRSSAVVEDSESASFAGQFDSVLNVGVASLEAAVKRCWASWTGERAMLYRDAHAVNHVPNMAVIVQAMVKAAKSGVAFTTHPTSNDQSVIVIEATPGLGDILVSGGVTPDRYVVVKDGLRVIDRSIGSRTAISLANTMGEGTTTIRPTEPQPRAACLGDEELRQLADVCRQIEKSRGGAPQDIEWAIDSEGKLFILQSRPVTA